MEHQTSGAPHRTMVRDTIAVAGIVIIVYLMFASVAAHREPDWAVFWLAAAALALGLRFYGRCANAMLDLIGHLRAAGELEDAGTRAD
jgi:hypothetical protein